MVRNTFNEIKGDIARVASGAGLTVTDDRLKARVNSIQTRLGYKGNWDGVFDTVQFTVYDKVLTLPMEYRSLSYIAFGTTPMAVMPEWYEFVENGPGPQDENGWVDKVVKRGLSPVIRQAADTPMIIRAYSYADERTDDGTPKIRIIGYDENGNWVRSEESGVWQDGIELSLMGHDATNYADSSIKFSRITRVIKPVTNERVELYWLDDDTTTTYFAAKYSHRETAPMYEQFVLPFLPTSAITDTEITAYPVTAICRRRIQKIVDGNEELLFDNLEAFRLGMIALAKEESDGTQESAYFWAEAKQCLVDEFVSVNGTSNAAPRLNVVGDNTLSSGDWDIF